MKQRILFFLLLLLVMSNGIIGQGFDFFITRNGYKLMEGDAEFRFISFNIPNLNFVEDELAFTKKSPYRLPTEYEIRDALISVKQMGGRVVRVYTLPVRRSDQPQSVPVSVLGPGSFNEEAYKVNDLMLAIANEVGIRIIFPIVNNWKWMGGRPQYAEFRGKTKDEFWTDPQLIDDVKKTIEYTLNRTNTITGVKYKDDKAILCWETGNELDSPPSWTITMCSYMKKLDKNHLVMDGWSRDAREEIITDPSVDIITTHHYEIDPLETLEHINKNLSHINGRKAYVIGEFGFQGTPALEGTINKIIAENKIAGGLIWSLRHHREEGGFYWHAEPLGLGVYKAYHWPGFASGHAYDETDLLSLMRKKAFEIQGKPIPDILPPAPPKILTVNSVFEINWQGSAGASSYIIERSENPSGPWQIIGKNVSDANATYTDLYHDSEATIGKTYYYRVKAENIAGISEPSLSSGPVMVKQQALIDDMSNYGKLNLFMNTLIESGDDRKFKEDCFRMGGKENSELVYSIPGNIDEIKVYAFEKTANRQLEILASTQGKEYSALTYSDKNYSEGENDYDAWLPIVYQVKAGLEGKKMVKISFKGEAKISRVVITFH